MDNCACDTGFQFFRLLSNSHIYSIHQQETEIHLETHAYQSLRYYYGNSGFSVRPAIQAFIRFDTAALQLTHYSILHTTTPVRNLTGHTQVSACLVRIPGERLAIRTWHLEGGGNVMVSAQILSKGR